MFAGKIGGNKFVAVGLFVVIISALLWFLNSTSPDLPILGMSIEIPGSQAAFDLPILGGILGTTLVILGFWRGW